MRPFVPLGLALALLGPSCAPPESFNGKVVDPPTTPELSATNWNGEPFTLGDHAGKVVVVFFGYTYCPDVCPFTLAKMKQLHARLGERAGDVVVVFASVDPHRDSLEKLAQYVPHFDERFYGLRLEQDELEVAQESFGVTVQYGQPKDGPGSDSYYYVDHTGTYFVLDRDGKLRLEFPPDATVEQMVPDVEKLLG
jgi:protein SCO1/2